MFEFDFTKETAFILYLRLHTASIRKSHPEPQVTSQLGFEERAYKC